jgi:hypothetical protein
MNNIHIKVKSTEGYIQIVDILQYLLDSTASGFKADCSLPT